MRGFSEGKKCQAVNYRQCLTTFLFRLQNSVYYSS